MGVQELQAFIETHAPAACVPVDLLKIARGVTLRQPRTPAARFRPPPAVELCLVLDAESCLDRLYGGYFSDWACGGQWNRMVQFLAVLIQTVQSNNMELAVFFSGSLELPRMKEWVTEQYEKRKNINQTLKHATLKSTPPPKVWWTAPSCLRTALRMALRHLKVQVLHSTEDHRQEVMSFCRDNNYHGVMAENAEYIVFNPPRFFSSKAMKLTYKGSLETRELVLSEVARGLDLQPGRFCLLAALLGNYLLTEEELQEFYDSLSTKEGVRPKTPAEVIDLVVRFVRGLPSVDCLDTVGARVFQSALDPRVAKLKQSVEYYVQGSREGGFKSTNGADGAPAGFASDAEAVASSQPLAEITERLNKLTTEDDGPVPGAAPGSHNGHLPAINGHMDMESDGPKVTLTPPPLPPVTAEVIRTASDRHAKGLMTPWVYQILAKGEIKIPVSMETELSRELPNATLFFRPVRERVYAILFNLYHHTFLHNKDSEKPASERHPVPVVQIREWAYSRNNPFTRPDLVTAKPLDWAVPTVQRLWFGTADDDRKRRLRAFLSCMNSDSATIRNPIYVPQQLIVLACVLRYIMSQSDVNGQSFLCKPELDAFIAQALSPKLTDSHYLQQLQLPAVTPRGIQLANLFMQGVETALFANDACGAPLPWLMCCPWLYFDGKLFHSYLLKAGQCRNVTQLCDNQPEMVGQLELVRQAVLDGLHVQYPRPPLAAQPRAGDAPLDRRGGQLEIGGVVVGSWAGSVGRGSVMPAGMHRRPAARGGHPFPAGKPGHQGGPRPKSQGKRKPASVAADSPPVPAGRAMTVDLGDTRVVGDLSIGGAAGDAPGQFLDRPLSAL